MRRCVSLSLRRCSRRFVPSATIARIAPCHCSTSGFAAGSMAASASFWCFAPALPPSACRSSRPFATRSTCSACNRRTRSASVRSRPSCRRSAAASCATPSTRTKLPSPRPTSVWQRSRELLDEAVRTTKSEERKANYREAAKDVAELKTKRAELGDAVKQMLAGRGAALHRRRPDGRRRAEIRRCRDGYTVRA